MRKTNISNLFFTAGVGILLVGCGGSDYDTSKDFTKLEGNSNPTFEQRASANVKEVDNLAEQYRVDHVNKNTNDATYNNNLNNTITNSNNLNSNSSNSTNNVVDNPNQQIGTMPVSNSSIPPVTNTDNNTNPPQGEVNPVSEANTHN